MKKLIYSVCIGSLALAVSGQAADNNDQNPRGRRAQRAQSTQTATVQTNHSAQANVRRNSNGPRFQQRSLNATRNNSGAMHQNRFRNANTSVSPRHRDFDQTRVRRSTVRNGGDVNRSRNVTMDRSRNFDGRNRNRELNRQSNVTINRQRNVTVNNNWRGSSFSGQQYSAFRNYHREFHDQIWWRSHYTRIIFVSGGCYFWNSGYWYPAWGYNPGYSYPYDGPIYGYNSLNPDQVVVNVQAQLQRDGYYSGPVDGELGPMTRQAIADFQADHGLAITSAVDQPTLATLGLV